jgi:xanthine dehydrogenase accessory factor
VDLGEPAATEGAVTVKNPCLSGGTLEIFLEPHIPPATLRVVGRSPIAKALADLAQRLGYAAELCAPDDAEPRADDAAVVVASHGHEEERVLAAALRDGVPYVGLVASDVRGTAVRESLDLPDELRTQLHTPVGLDIGAETPEEIALAILGEIVALRRAGDAAVQAELAASAPAAAVATDPVCGMEVAVSDASIQVEINGERHYFCSEGCRDSFVAQAAPDVSVG